MRSWRFCLWAGLILWVLMPGNALADTLFKAGGGKNLVFGRSIITVNLPDALGKESNVKCLLMGAVRGKPAVYALDHAPARNNKLYLVEILDSSRAFFANRAPNIVPVEMKGNRMPFDRIIGYGSHPLGRILELPDPENKGESMLLFTHGTGDLYALSLKETTDPKTGLKTLKAVETGKWSSSIRYINLDLIDLNGAVANREGKAAIPAAVAVWYQREGKVWNTRNFSNQANSLALASFDKASGLELYQTDLNDKEPFNDMSEGPDFWHLKKWERHRAPTVVGGAFANPDQKGAVTYWFSRNAIEYRKTDAQLVLTEIDVEHFMETWGAEIIFNQAENRLELKTPVKANAWWWQYWTKDWGKADYWADQFIRWTTGPYLRNDESNNLYIDHYISNPPHDKGPGWTLASNSIGKLHVESVSDGSVKGVSEYDGKSEEELTAMQKRERDLVNGNANVAMVVYGWPYFAVLGAPSPANTPSFTRKWGTQHIGWTKGSYGGGFEADIGVGGMAPIGQWSKSLIGGFSWESGTEKTDVETQSVTISVSYHDTSFDDFTRWGIVVYNTIKPEVSAWYSFMPENGATISVQGLDSYAFVFPVLSLSVGQDAVMLYERFDVTQPDRLIGQDVIPSPLSAGLAARDVSTTLTRESRDAAVKAIRAWEQETRLKQFLALAKTPDKTGVRINQVHTYKLDNDATLDASKTASTTATDDKEWYGGFNWSFKPSIPIGPVMDITVKHTGSFSTKDTETTERSYSLQTRGVADSYLGQVLFNTYFIDIKIAALKSYIYRNMGKRDAFDGKPAFIPDWNWKYNQDFTLVVTEYSRTTMR